MGVPKTVSNTFRVAASQSGSDAVFTELHQDLTTGVSFKVPIPHAVRRLTGDALQWAEAVARVGADAMGARSHRIDIYQCWYQEAIADFGGEAERMINMTMTIGKVQQ